jgi:hypothetical protein
MGFETPPMSHKEDPVREQPDGNATAEPTPNTVDSGHESTPSAGSETGSEWDQRRINYKAPTPNITDRMAAWIESPDGDPKLEEEIRADPNGLRELMLMASLWAGGSLVSREKAEAKIRSVFPDALE